jgi:neopullulanase
MNMKKIRVLFGLMLMSATLMGQEVKLERVEPPNWWTGFKNQSLQLLVHGPNIGLTTPELKYSGVTLNKVNTVASPNYLFLDLSVTDKAKAGSFTITFKLKGKKIAEYRYQLDTRKPGSAERKGFSSADVIYLLMPDRFSNGDPSNDNMPGMKEPANRNNPDGRHGGDIKGIADHVDYLKDLGITAVWSTPLLENNMEKYSYHGYAITDYYKIDPRYGTNEDYLALAEKLHASGIKIIMDMVFNHCGSGHWWMDDLPSTNWLNQWPEFTRTNYRAGTMTDPYLSDYDSGKFVRGWFDVTMPDLNQHHPFLAKYLIQNSIWWIEYAGLDGIRQDTYPYAFKDMMAEWDKAVTAEYPNFNIVGECWATVPEGIAYWQKDSPNRDGFNSYLPSVFDFAMYDALRLGFMENNGWNTGVGRLYDLLSRDFVYPDPSHIVVFADNHDVNRFLANAGQDPSKFKMALAFVLTTRGIPEIFYGTEALLTTTGEKNDGRLRIDFPGGWPGDTVNSFTGTNVTAAQADMSSYLKKILNWRKNAEAIHTGKLKHYIPQDGVYVYFRYNDKQTVMVAINNSEQERNLNTAVFSEFLSKFASATDIISGKIIDTRSDISIPPMSGMILELGN